MRELTDSDRADAKLLAEKMNGWLRNPDGWDESMADASPDLVEWCRAARDVLERVAVSGG